MSGVGSRVRGVAHLGGQGEDGAAGPVLRRENHLVHLQNPTAGLCLGPYGDPIKGEFSYE